MSDELKPCPKCGQPVTGGLCGGPAAYGCREWEYEVECGCGLLWSCSPGDVDEDEAVRRGVQEWNARAERTCRWVPFDEGHSIAGPGWSCSECGLELGLENVFVVEWCYCCPGCGSKVVG